MATKVKARPRTSAICLADAEQPTAAVWIGEDTYAFDISGAIFRTNSYNDYGQPIWEDNNAKRCEAKDFGGQDAHDTLWVSLISVETAARMTHKLDYIGRLPRNCVDE